MSSIDHINKYRQRGSYTDVPISVNIYLQTIYIIYNGIYIYIYIYIYNNNNNNNTHVVM